MSRSAYPFAPGAIERFPSLRSQAFARWAKRAAALAITALVVGVVAGIASGIFGA